MISCTNLETESVAAKRRPHIKPLHFASSLKARKGAKPYTPGRLPRDRRQQQTALRRRVFSGQALDFSIKVGQLKLFRQLGVILAKQHAHLLKLLFVFALVR